MPIDKNSTVEYNIRKLKPRYKRLANDHIKLHELVKRSDLIDYEITKRTKSLPPEGYRIIYHVKSIIRVDASQNPIFGNKHKVTISLPPDYPGPTGDPVCKMETPVWHPNIRWSGDYKGRICITAKALGAWHDLDLLVVRIGEILQYKNYLAENIPPYPEDETVAKWVRDYGEPNDIVNFKKGIVIDNRELLKPLEGFDSSRFIQTDDLKIIIKPRRKPGSGSSGGIVINPRN